MDLAPAETQEDSGENRDNKARDWLRKNDINLIVRRKVGETRRWEAICRERVQYVGGTKDTKEKNWEWGIRKVRWNSEVQFQLDSWYHDNVYT